MDENNKNNENTENVENEENKKEIEVISGDGNLDISPVYDHIDIEKPEDKKQKKQIVIPEEKKN